MSDDDLVERCRTGDEQAWRELHRAHYPYVHRIARKLGARDEELDDVVQDVFIVAHRRLGDFRYGKLSTWLYQITSNIVFSRNRGRKLRETLFSWFGGADEPAAAVAPDRLTEAREAEAQVAKVLERMSDKKREVFVLYELEGLPGEEISELVGCPVQTVWTRLHYARRDFEKLARELGVVEGGAP